MLRSNRQGRHREESQFPSGRSFHPRSCARLSHPSHIRVQSDSQFRIPNPCTRDRIPDVERQADASSRSRATTKNFPRASAQKRPTLWNHPQRQQKLHPVRVRSPVLRRDYIELIGVMNLTHV